MYTTIPYQVTVKTTPVSPDQFEMYNVTDDPMELNNLYDNTTYSSEQNLLAQLLQQQRCAKRLTPSSGTRAGSTAELLIVASGCDLQACQRLEHEN